MQNEIIISKGNAVSTLLTNENRTLLSADGQKMFDAKRKMQLKNIPESEAIPIMRDTLKYIAIDVCYKIPEDRTTWQYMQTRLYQLLKEYYGTMTISEIKLAFEFLMLGKLDKYLPLDKNKNPMHEHYQRFNIDYFSMVLKAYQRKRDEVFAPIYERPKLEAPKGNNTEWRKSVIRDVIMNYKYRGRFDKERVGMHFVYEFLVNAGFAEEVIPTQEDKHRAFMEYRRRVVMGLEKSIKATYNIRQGENADVFQEDARIIARNKEIVRAIEELITEGYNGEY